MIGPDALAYLVGVVVIATQIGVAVFLAREHGLLPHRARNDWSNAVRVVADEYGLAHRSVAMSFDAASGSVGRADVEIGSDSDDDVVSMRVTVFLPTLSDGLRIRRPGAALPRSDAFGARITTGVTALDDAVEIAGARAALVSALRADESLASLVLHVVRDLGAVLDDRHLVLLRRRFASTPGELRDWLASMLELAHRLERPNGPGDVDHRGSEWTVRLRRAKRSDEDARAEVVAFLDAIAPRFGPATVHAPDGERDVELRGTFRGHPLRIAIDDSLAPELTIACPSRGATLYLEQDPDVDARDPRPPAWDEREDEKHFLGRTTYVEASRERLERIRRELAAMPDALRAALGTELERHGIRYFRPDSRQVWVMFWPTLDQMPDPVATIEASLALMLAVSEHRATEEEPPDDEEGGELEEDEDEDE